MQARVPFLGKHSEEVFPVEVRFPGDGTKPTMDLRHVPQGEKENAIIVVLKTRIKITHRIAGVFQTVQKIVAIVHRWFHCRVLLK